MNPSDEFQKRQAEKPDKWTLAWWDEQYRETQNALRGAMFSMNIAHANYQDAMKADDELKARCEAMEADIRADRAKLGELQARVERMASYLNRAKNGKSENPC